MIDQLSKVTDFLLHQIATLCDDPFMKDFDPTRYKEAYYRGLRKVAREYSVLNRVYEFNSKIVVPPGVSSDEYIAQQKLEDVKLDIYAFNGEYMVIINNQEYKKGQIRDLVLDSYTYYIFHGHDDYLFNYSPRTENDRVLIYYNANIDLHDFETEEFSPVVPSKYQEEVIKYTIQWLAIQGVSKFREQKKVKWVELGTLFGIRDFAKKELKVGENMQVKIKPWSFP